LAQEAAVAGRGQGGPVRVAALAPEARRLHVHHRRAPVQGITALLLPAAPCVAPHVVGQALAVAAVEAVAVWDLPARDEVAAAEENAGVGRQEESVAQKEQEELVVPKPHAVVHPEAKNEEKKGWWF
jgi:hypothetical protein